MLCRVSGLDRTFVQKLCHELYKKILGTTKVIYADSTIDQKPKLPDLELNVPLFLELIITYRCNLRCRHCLVGDLRYSEDADMSLEIVRKIASEVRKYSIFEVVLTGGEPTIRKDFFTILEWLSDSGAFIAVTTHGLTLSKRKIERMRDYNIFKYVVSLEGATSKTHDFIRGNGTFNAVIRTIERIRDYTEAVIEINVTCGKHNIGEIEDIVNLAHRMGAQIVNFSRLRPWGWGSSLRPYLLDSSEISFLNRKIKELRKKYKDIYIGGDMPIMVERQAFVCDAMFAFTIQPNGNVLPCTTFEQSPTAEVILGNMNNQDIAGIWNSEKARAMRRRIQRHSDIYPTCISAGCPIHSVCAKTYCLAEWFVSTRTLSNDLAKCTTYRI